MLAPIMPAATPPVCIQALPDIVSVRGGESLRTVEASWHVNVTLDPPQLPQLLVNRIIDLKAILRKPCNTYGSEIKLRLPIFQKSHATQQNESKF